MSASRVHHDPRRVGAVAVLAFVSVLAACGDDPADGGDVSSGDGAATLAGTEWQLREVTVDGTTIEVPADVDAVVRFDGEGGWSSQACNSIGGGVEIDGTRLTFDGTATGTEMGCEDVRGDIDTAVTAALQGEVEAAIDGDALTLTGAGDDRLRLEVRDGIFPSRTMIPLDQGTRGDGDYRFGYEGSDGELWLAWEFRPAPGHPWGTAGIATPSDPHRPDPASSLADGSAEFVFGPIGTDVARVVYEPPAGEPTELALHRLDGMEGWQAYGGFVEEPVTGAHVVAYDADGEELGRSVDLYASDPG